MDGGAKSAEGELTSAQVNAILTDEYKLLWAYYIKLLDEKHKTIDYFFKTTAIPAGAITAAAGYFGLGGEHATEKLAAALISLLIVGIIGIISLVVYAKECANGHIYMESIKAVRAAFSKQNATLNEFIIFNNFKSKKANLHHFTRGAVKTWRGGFISAINSAVFSSSLFILLHYNNIKINNVWYILLYLVIALIHVLLFIKSYNNYVKVLTQEPGNELIPAAINTD